MQPTRRPNESGSVGLDVFLGVLLSLPAPVIGFFAGLAALAALGNYERVFPIVLAFTVAGLGYLGFFIWLFRRKGRPGLVIGLTIGTALYLLLSSACFLQM